MSQPTNRWKLGLFVLIGIGSILSATAWFGAERLHRETVLVHSYFDQDVTGLAVGSAVSFRGIPIGKVAKIQAAPDRRHVHVVSNIYVDALRDLGFLSPFEDAPEGTSDAIPPDVRVQLVGSFITGVSTMEIDFVDVERFPVSDYPFAIPEATIYPIPSTLNQLEKSLVDALAELPTVLKSATEALESVGAAIEDLQLRELSTDVHQLLTSLESTIAKLELETLAERGGAAFDEIRTSLDEVRSLAAELRADDGPLVQLLRRYEALGAELSAALLASDLPETTASLRETADAISGAGDEAARLGRELRGETTDLGTTLAAARRLLELLERDPAALLRGR